MERYNIFENLKEAREGVNAFKDDCFSGIVLDGALANAVVKENPQFAAKRIMLSEVTDTEKLPENIIASYAVEQGVLHRKKYINKGNYIVYTVSSDSYINLTGEKAVSTLIKKGELINDNRDSYTVSGSIFPTFPIWSNTLKNEYKQLYNENLADKLALLFLPAQGYERFRERYYRLLREAVARQFLEAVKQRSREMGAKFYGSATCAVNFASQVLPSNAFAGWASIYDKLYVRCPRELMGEDFLRKYFRLFTGVNRGKIVAEITFDTFCLLSLDELKFLADRLIASGVRYFSIAARAKLTVALSKKKELIADYISRLLAALSLGKRQCDMLVVYPSSAAAADFNVSSPDSTRDFAGNIDSALNALNKNGILYDIASEYQIGTDIKISGSLATVNSNAYSGVIMLQGKTVTPKMAGFIIKYAENGGRVYSLSDLPELIDGFKSSKLSEVVSCIKQLEEDKLSLLRSEETPLFTDSGVDMLAVALPDNSKLYLAARILSASGSFSLNSFGDITHINLINETEKLCLLGNKIGKVMGRQIVELGEEHKGSAIFCVGKPFEDKKEEQGSSYISLSPYFEITQALDNSLILENCRVRVNSGIWSPEKPLWAAIKGLASNKKHYSAEFKFKFKVASTDEKTDIHLYFKNQNSCDLSVNLNPVLCSGSSFIDITEHIILGENFISLKFSDFGSLYNTDASPLNNLVLRGNFCVNATAENGMLSRALRQKKEFSIAKSITAVSIERILESGYWFFDNSISLAQKFFVEKKEGRYLFGFSVLNALAAEITVNGYRAGDICFKPYTADITDYVIEGDNTVEITLFANQANFRALNSKTRQPEFEPFGAKIKADEEKSAFICGYDVSKSYIEREKRIEALKSLNFGVNKGELTVIYGDEGAGKTTLFNILAGILSADSGKIELDGEDITQKTENQLCEYRKRDVALIFSGANMLSGYTVAENVAMASPTPLRKYDLNLMLHSVKMADKAKLQLQKLSIAEQKRTALAAALAKNPKLILCDEPTAEIGTEQGIELARLLREVSRLTEKTVIIFTDNEAICEIADTVINLADGCIAE